MFVGVGVAPLLAFGGAGKARWDGLAVAQTPHAAEGFFAGLADGNAQRVAVAIVGNEVKLTGAEPTEVGLGSGESASRAVAAGCCPVRAQTRYGKIHSAHSPAHPHAAAHAHGRRRGDEDGRGRDRNRGRGQS